MRALNERERRTIKLAGGALGIYLVLFYGLAGWRALEARRAEYDQLRTEATDLGTRVLEEHRKHKRLGELRERWNIDLASLDETTIVNDVREAIQKAAGRHKVAVGPSQETGRRSAAKELRVIQFTGSGATRAVMAFVDDLPRLGFPLVVDHLQVKPLAKKPGMVTYSMRVAILNFRPWKEGPRA